MEVLGGGYDLFALVRGTENGDKAHWQKIGIYGIRIEQEEQQ